MKKKIALVLCIVLLTFSFFGCSQAELGYFNMARDMSAQSYEMSGKVDGQIDFDAIKDIIDETCAKVAETDPVTAAFLKDSLVIEQSGRFNVSLTYDAKVNMTDSIALYGDFDISVNGKVYPLGDLYFDMKEGLSLSKDMLLGFYDLSKEFLPEYADSYFYTEEYRAELVEAFSEIQYLKTSWADEFSEEDVDEILSLMPAMTTDIYDSAVEFLANGFEGFTSNTITPISGGYRISVDGEKLQTLLSDLLLHVISNADQVMEAYKVYTLKIMDYMALPEEDAAATKAELETIFGDESRIMVVAVAAEARQVLTELQNGGYLNFLDGLKYEASVQKSGRNYVESENFSLRSGFKTALSLKSQATLTVKNAEILLPAEGSSLEDGDAILHALEQKYNPVTQTVIMWWKSSYPMTYAWNWADVTYTRDKDGPLSPQEELTYGDYRIINNSLYVPLRSICETFGETVTWDNSAKKAYVVRGDQQIEMTGYLDYATTFVKICDFEKLGYTVKYSKDVPNYHKATISK